MYACEENSQWHRLCRVGIGMTVKDDQEDLENEGAISDVTDVIPTQWPIIAQCVVASIILY